MSVNAEERPVGLGKSIVLGLGAILSVGAFSIWGPVARVADKSFSNLFAALAIAAALAYLSTTSAAALAIRGQSANAFSINLSEWARWVAMVAGSAALALTLGANLWTSHQHLVAVLAVVAMTALARAGITLSPRLRWAIALVVLVTVAVAVAAVALRGHTGHSSWARAAYPDAGIMQAAGLLFFAFAAVGRSANDTGSQTGTFDAALHRRADAISLGLAAAAFAATGWAVLHSRSPINLSYVDDALRNVIFNGTRGESRLSLPLSALSVVVTLVAVVATATALLSVLHQAARSGAGFVPGSLPGSFTVLATGAFAAALSALTDLRGAIGLCSFALLIHYAVANVGAWRLRQRPWLAALGCIGCLAVAFSLPITSVLDGAAFLAVGPLILAWRRSSAAPSQTVMTGCAP